MNYFISAFDTYDSLVEENFGTEEPDVNRTRRLHTRWAVGDCPVGRMMVDGL